MTTNSDETIEIIRRHVRPLEPDPTGVEARLESLPGIRAVLFDIYGTMLISGCGEVGTVATDGRCEAVSAAFEAIHVPLRGDPSQVVEVLDAVIREHQDVARRKGVEYPEVDILAVWADVLEWMAREKWLDRTDSKQVDPGRLSVEYEVRANPVWPMPHLEASLDRLSRSNRLLGVVSNAQSFTPKMFPALVGRSLVELSFDEKLLFYSHEHGSAKPGPRLFELACNELESRGIGPHAVVYVGNDMLNDVATAARTGMRTALFAGDARSLRMRETDSRVEGFVPDVVLTDLAQLIDCLAPPEYLPPRLGGNG